MEKFTVLLRGGAINIRYTCKGQLPIPTGYSIDPDRFQDVYGSWVLNAKGKPDPVINGKIIKMLSDLQEKANKFFIEKDQYPTKNQFKKYLQPGQRVDHTFDSAWADFLYEKTHQGHKSVSLARLGAYKRVKRYIDEMSPGLTLQSIDLKWAGQWVDWLVKEKKAKQNYLGALCNIVIAFLHHCDDNEIAKLQKKVFKKLRQEEQDLDVFFHPTEELRKMLNKDLSRWPDLDDTRNKYCLQCMLGMRRSDHFDNDWDPTALMITKAAIKTRETITIPIRTEARELIRKMLNREGGYREVPEPVYNKEIKEVGELCEITHLVTMVHGKRKFKAGHKYQKFELMSSHMARSTFVCQMIELGVPYMEIMAMTGIRSFDTLKKYAAVMDVTLSNTMAMVEAKQALNINPKAVEMKAIAN